MVRNKQTLRGTPLRGSRTWKVLIYKNRRSYNLYFSYQSAIFFMLLCMCCFTCGCRTVRRCTNKCRDYCVRRQIVNDIVGEHEARHADRRQQVFIAMMERNRDGARDQYRAGSNINSIRARIRNN